MNGLLNSPDKSGIATLIGTGFSLVTLVSTVLFTAISAMTVMVG
ncbi:hypothetical protein ACFOON_13445 [Novosphingobium piscinae]|nr:hypothetical protein [Novosphingobium piscinae]